MAAGSASESAAAADPTVISHSKGDKFDGFHSRTKQPLLWTTPTTNCVRLIVVQLPRQWRKADTKTGVSVERTGRFFDDWETEMGKIQETVSKLCTARDPARTHWDSPVRFLLDTSYVPDKNEWANLTRNWAAAAEATRISQKETSDWEPEFSDTGREVVVLFARPSSLMNIFGIRLFGGTVFVAPPYSSISVVTFIKDQKPVLHTFCSCLHDPSWDGSLWHVKVKEDEDEDEDEK